MKLTAWIEVNSQPLHLISYDVALLLNDAGIATFRVKSRKKPQGIVIFECGYTTGKMHRFFIGYVKSANAESNKSWVLHCVELIQSLEVLSPISLRRCFIQDVIKEVKANTQLQFVLDDQITQQISRFTNTTRAFNAIRNLERAFQIKDFVYYQQTDGDVWLGNWQHSPYAQLGTIEVDEQLYQQHQANSATLPALPALRPGMVLNGKRLSHVRLRDHKSTFRWKPS